MSGKAQLDECGCCFICAPDIGENCEGGSNRNPYYGYCGRGMCFSNKMIGAVGQCVAGDNEDQDSKYQH